MQTEVTKALLTESEAAQYLRYKRQTLAARRCLGNPLLPYLRVGRAIRYKLEDIQLFIARNREDASDGY